MKQHTEDYKLSAVKYYLNNNDDLRNTCKIFDCKKTSLNRWVTHYKKHQHINRKTRKNHNLKITTPMENLVKETLQKYPTTTL